MSGSTANEPQEQFLPAETVLDRAAQDDIAPKKRSRKSLGRRVSFAPDAQLEVRHMYNREGTPDQNTDPNLKAQNSLRAAAAAPNLWRRESFPPVPEETAADSPSGSTMDLTGGTAELSSRLPANNQEPRIQVPDEVTAGIPSLAELAQSDGDTDQLPARPFATERTPEQAAKTGQKVPREDEPNYLMHHEILMENYAEATGDVSMDLTEHSQAAAENTTNHSIGGYTKVLEAGNHPTWGGLEVPAERVDRPEARAADEPDDGREQINKWGFAPGNDDTLELNLEFRGRNMMGDTTFNYVHGQATQSSASPSLGQQQAALTLTEHSNQLPPSDLDDLFSRAGNAAEVLQSAIKANLNSPGSVRRRSTVYASVQKMSELQLGSGSPTQNPRRTPIAFQDAPVGRLSEAFSLHSTMAQRAGHMHSAASPAPSMGTPLGFTPTSRMGTAPLTASGVPRGSSLRPTGPATGDLLSGDPFPEGQNTPKQREQTGYLQVITPSGPLQSFMSRAGITGSAEQPLIDLGTPRSEQAAGSSDSPAAAELRKRRGETASPMAASKRRMSAANDLTGKLLEEDDTDNLLEANESPALMDADPGSAVRRHMGRDVTTRLLLEDGTASPAPRPLQIAGGMLLRAFAAAAPASLPQQAAMQNLTGDKTLATTRLLAESTENSPMMVSAESAGGIASTAAVTPAAKPRAVNEDATMDLELGDSPLLLDDVSTEGLEPPPEPATGWEDRYRATTDSASAPTPAPPPSMFPGGVLLQRTPPPARAAAAPQLLGSPRTRSQSKKLAEDATANLSSPVPSNADQSLVLGGFNLARTPPATRGKASGKQQQEPPLPAVTPKPPLYPGTLPASTGVKTRSAAKAAKDTPSPRSAPRGAHRLARVTPARLLAPPKQLSFDEFLREIDIQFLDHMRRGASIYLADLATDPPPHSLQDAYKLMCLTAPEAAQYEDGMQTLQNETDARKATIRQKEAELEGLNLPIFAQVQTAGPDDLEAIKCGTQALKKLCRLRTQVSWKEWRSIMEAQKGQSLQSKVRLLQHDKAFLQSNLNYLTELGDTVQQFARDSRESAAKAAEEHASEVARRQRVRAARASLSELTAANKEREAKKCELADQLSDLKAKHAVLGADRVRLRGLLEQRRAESEASQKAAAAFDDNDATPDAVLSKVYDFDILKGIVGWRLETGAQEMEMCVKFWRLFKLQIFFNRSDQEGTTAARGFLTLASQDESPNWTPATRDLAARLVRGVKSSNAEVLGEFAIPDTKREPLQAVMQQLGRRLGRIYWLLHEIEGLRLDFPALCNISLEEDGFLKLSFLDLPSQTLFSVTMELGVNGIGAATVADVHFSGHGLTNEAILKTVAAVRNKFWRVRSVCQALSRLARGGHGQQVEPAVASGAAGDVTMADAGDAAEAAGDEGEASLHVFSNPLFTSRTPAAARQA